MDQNHQITHHTKRGYIRSITNHQSESIDTDYPTSSLQSLEPKR